MQLATASLGFATLLICCKSVIAQQFVTRAQVTQCLQAAPKPYYTEFQAAHHFGESGLFIMRIRAKTGRVAEVRVAQSTGHPGLDSAAVRALSGWRFKPGCLSPIKGDDALLRIPVTFALRH
jgi:protein TonB